MSAEIKGWCPSAHRPMMSGDGLLVRVKPRLARLDASQTLRLCRLAERLGNGMIDITSRANLQIRGVTEADYPELLTALIDANLVDNSQAKEAVRRLTVTPFWQTGDQSNRLATAVEEIDLPELPDKIGIVVDTGLAPVLRETPGDFRFETSEGGDLILRAGGAERGYIIDEAEATSALTEMVAWFLKTCGAQSGRMGRHLNATTLPTEWQTTRPMQPAGTPLPGATTGGRLFGVPFGQTRAIALQQLMENTGANHMRVTPWRMFFLEDASPSQVPGFLNHPDPLLDVAACPGAPACAQATVATRELAQRLVGQVRGTLHVSGCAKGCARRSPSTVTLVGREGRFDLVQDGMPGDTPVYQGLDEADILQQIGADHAL